MSCHLGIFLLKSSNSAMRAKGQRPVENPLLPSPVPYVVTDKVPTQQR